MNKKTIYDILHHYIEELAKGVSFKMDIDVAWLLLESEKFIKKAKQLNAKFGGKKIFDKRTRGGKYLAQKKKEFEERMWQQWTKKND